MDNRTRPGADDPVKGSWPKTELPKSSSTELRSTDPTSPRSSYLVSQTASAKLHDGRVSKNEGVESQTASDKSFGEELRGFRDTEPEKLRGHKSSTVQLGGFTDTESSTEQLGGFTDTEPEKLRGHKSSTVQLGGFTVTEPKKLGGVGNKSSGEKLSGEKLGGVKSSGEKLGGVGNKSTGKKIRGKIVSEKLRGESVELLAVSGNLHGMSAELRGKDGKVTESEKLRGKDGQSGNWSKKLRGESGESEKLHGGESEKLRGDKDHIRDTDIKLGLANRSKDERVAPSSDRVLLQGSAPETPESSSPMTNTPKIDEAQDVFSFQRMKVSEISPLQKLPKNLHSLKIEGCDVLDKIPEEVMASIPFLQRLYIINCCSLKSFPEPVALKILHIQNCKKLDFPPSARKPNQYALLEYLCIGSSCDSLISLPLDLFPKLRCLSIWDCENLKSLSIQEGNQKGLTSLEALEIRDCPNLVNFLEGGLPTPNLTSIWLSNCKNLNKLPHLLHTLGSLRSIFVNNCPELESLPVVPDKGLPSNLGLLSITSCDKLTLTGKWGLNRLDCLIKLEIEGGCKNVESFPEENLLPSTLISLRVSGLLDLKRLDYKGLQQLTTLKTLEISCCDKLESLPEGLPSSLSVLCIKECSLLKPKLKKQTGDYWQNIAHISFIETDEKVISRKSPV